jgi:hypothetical protein
LSNKIIPRNLALVSNVIKSFSYSMAWVINLLDSFSIRINSLIYF